jgi:hypothetical protein
MSMGLCRIKGEIDEATLLPYRDVGRDEPEWILGKPGRDERRLSKVLF